MANEKNRELDVRELDEQDLPAVAGGFDDGDWCGTGRKPTFPPPPRPHA